MLTPAAKLVALLKPKRTTFQFKLRSMFVLVVIAALLCGWLEWKMVRKERERAAVAEINKVGGYVLYDWEKPFDKANARPPGAAWLRKLLGDDFFASVVWVNVMHRHEIADEWLVCLEPLSDLAALYVNDHDNSITDAGVRYLSRFKKLRYLSLVGTGITDAGLADLNSLTELNWLDVSHTEVTDAGLVNLKALTALQSLNLADTAVTDAGLNNLKVLSQLREVWVPGAGVTAMALPICKGRYHIARYSTASVAPGLASKRDADTIVDPSRAHSNTRLLAVNHWVRAMEAPFSLDPVIDFRPRPRALARPGCAPRPPSVRWPCS